MTLISLSGLMMASTLFTASPSGRCYKSASTSFYFPAVFVKELYSSVVVQFESLRSETISSIVQIQAVRPAAIPGVVR